MAQNNPATLADVLTAMNAMAAQIGTFGQQMDDLGNRLQTVEGQAQAPLQQDPLQQNPPQQNPQQPPRELRSLDTKGEDRLTGEPTSLEYRLWLRGWHNYEVRWRVEKYPRAEQVAALTSCFSKAFLHFYTQNVEPGMTLATPNEPTTAEILTAVGNYVRDSNGGLKDRLAFLQRRQQQG